MTVAPMIVLMLALMPQMYPDRKLNLILCGVSVAVLIWRQRVSEI